MVDRFVPLARRLEPRAFVETVARSMLIELDMRLEAAAAQLGSRALPLSADVTRLAAVDEAVVVSGASLTSEAMARAIPLRRIGQPDDYAGMIAFLLSDDSAYMTGQTVSVSGGLAVADGSGAGAMAAVLPRPAKAPPVPGRLCRTEATTLRNCLRSTGLVR